MAARVFSLFLLHFEGFKLSHGALMKLLYALGDALGATSKPYVGCLEVTS